METTVGEILGFILDIRMFIGYFIGLGLGYLWGKNNTTFKHSIKIKEDERE